MNFDNLRNIFMFTLITALLWLVFEVYNANYSSTIPDVKKRVAEPINAEVNVKLLEELADRDHYSTE